MLRIVFSVFTREPARGINSSVLEIVLPNCVCIATRVQCTTATATGGTIVFIKNDTAVTGLGIPIVTGDTLVQDLNTNTSFVLGDVIRIRFNNTGGTMGGTLWGQTAVNLIALIVQMTIW